jgi:SMP-30/Gluconolactonase/LRE-like region
MNFQRESHDFNAISWHGEGLVRPECVLATRSGAVYSADWRGGVAQILLDGTQSFFAAQVVDGEKMKPNGIALCADGSFLLAHLGDTRGGVFRLRRNGETTPVLTHVDGRDMPPTNFVVHDRQDRLYTTVSTRLQPRALGYRKTCNDGFIVLSDTKGDRIVADGLGYTNEIAFDASGKWLYVNETFTRTLSRFPVLSDGGLGAKQIVTEFGAGTFPDGMALDEEGGIWIVSIVSNRLIYVGLSGEQRIVLEDAEAVHLAEVERAYGSNTMGRPHLDGIKSKHFKNISSIAFAGANRRTGIFGCLLGDRLACVPMPVAGLAPIHWEYA